MKHMREKREKGRERESGRGKKIAHKKPQKHSADMERQIVERGADRQRSRERI